MTSDARSIWEHASFMRALVFTTISATLFGMSVGMMTDAIDIPWLSRLSPNYALDYPILGLNSALVGSLAAIHRYASRHHNFSAAPILAGGLLSALAVSCPLCNNIIRTVFGASTAASVFDPLRPVLGIITTTFMTYILWKRICTVRHISKNIAIPATTGP